ncbi:MAG: hypothetical protein NTX19_07870 [Gemmatimonadetes bacterium]|nr:hypothetical protein [Gemmatimonadota bacterium]
MMRRVLFLAALLCAARDAVGAQAQPPRTDTTTRRDTAQKLPSATIKEAAENLPEPFLRRSRIRGTGKFLTAKDIEVINPPHTPQLLARVSGGDIRDIGSGNVAIVGNRGTRMSMVGSVASQLCIIGLALNDVRLPPGFDLKAIKPDDIAAIEFYNGPSSIPLELGGTLQSDANCGLFVIWLKDFRRKAK